MLRLRFLFALALGLAGCAADTTIDAEDYDESCSTDADCTNVFVGDVCGCGCTTAPISVAEIERYAADQRAKMSACEEVLTCEACADDPPPICKQGTCAQGAIR